MLSSEEVLESILAGATTGHTPAPSSGDAFLGQLTEQVANRLAAVIWRPLPETAPVLVVAVKKQLGETVLRQRCVVQAMRGILAPLAPNFQPFVLEKLKAAYAATEWGLAADWMRSRASSKASIPQLRRSSES